MDWTQFGILMITLGGLFLWNRSESNADRRDVINLVLAIQQEMKDFHGRLCVIEDRYIQMMQRILEKKSAVK